MRARSPNRMLLSHPSTPPTTASAAIRRHPQMIRFFNVGVLLFPNLQLGLCLIYNSTLPVNTGLVKKPPKTQSDLPAEPWQV